MQPKPRKVVCLQCRRSHTKCDGQQPCRRCVGAGLADQCCLPPPSRRGRPPLGIHWEQTVGVPPAASAPAPSVAPVTQQARAHHPLPVRPAPGPSPMGSAFPTMMFPSSNAPAQPPIAPMPPFSDTRYNLAGLVRDRNSSPASDSEQPPSKIRRTSIDAANAAARVRSDLADEGSGTEKELRQLKAVLTLLIEQVRDTKRANADLRAEVLELRSRIDDNEKNHQVQLDELREMINRRPSKRYRSSTSTSSTSAIIPSTPGPLELVVKKQAIVATLPFFSEYVDFLDTFAVNDIRGDAYAVFYVGEPKSVEELSVKPPIFVHTSAACCSLTGFSQDELLGKPISMLCQTEKEMVFVILARFFSKPERPAGETFLTTMTWATKDKRGLAVRLRHQIFYNRQRQPKWYVLVVDSVLDDDAPMPPLSISDILHNPPELQRFKSQFSAFFDSLYTTKTITTTVTTFNAPDVQRSFMDSATSTRFSSLPLPFPSPLTMPSAQTLAYHQQFSPPHSSPTSSLTSSSPDIYEIVDQPSTHISTPKGPYYSAPSPRDSISSSSNTTQASPMAPPQRDWTAISLSELLQDEECRAILQEQQRKAAEGQNASQSLDDMLDEFLSASPAATPRQADL